MIPGDRPPERPDAPAAASSPVEPDEAVAPRAPKWLASAQGLVPGRGAGQMLPPPAREARASEFDATRIHPRSADPAAGAPGPASFGLRARSGVVAANPSAASAQIPARP